jgi:hypothetical protein
VSLQGSVVGPSYAVSCIGICGHPQKRIIWFPRHAKFPQIKSTWNEDLHCIRQLSVTIRNALVDQLIKKKDLLWLTISEILVHGWLALLLSGLWWACGEGIVGQNHSSQDQDKQREEEAGPQCLLEVTHPVTWNLPQGPASMNVPPVPNCEPNL